MGELGLFDRLPSGLFRPLAAKGHVGYWNLLLRLYDRYFGPEATPPEGDGYIRRSITLEIERFIDDNEAWQTDAGFTASETSLAVQSNYYLGQLIEAGWLKEDRIGVRQFLVMPTTVQKFLELLRQFAEEGPQLIGGKVQMIYNQLQQASINPEKEFSGFHEAALQARQLVSILAATNMRVREAMEMLAANDDTGAYIREFFDSYIGKLYIQDYHDLRTENHPLRHRWAIVKIAHLLRDDPDKREIMVKNYEITFKCTSRTEAESRFEKDISRILMFSDIDSHLDRLNTSVERATSRAISYIQYKLRTQSQLDRMLTLAIERLDKGSEPAMSLMPAPLVAESRIPLPSKRATATARTPIVSKPMSVEQQALIRLKRAMKASREVSIDQLRAYLQRHVGNRSSISSDELPITTIHDFCLFIVVSRLAYASRNSRDAGHQTISMLTSVSEFRFECILDEWTDNPYLKVQKFMISNRHLEKQHAA